MLYIVTSLSLLVRLISSLVGDAPAISEGKKKQKKRNLKKKKLKANHPPTHHTYPF